MQGRRSILVILLCNLFLSLTVVFFLPMEVVLGNQKEFFFSFGSIWWLQVLIAIAIALILSLLMFFLPPKAGTVAAAVSLGIGIAFWAQSMFLNSEMGTLTGEAIEISETGTIINTAIWVLLIAGTITVISIFIKKRHKQTRLAMCLVAGALTLMQAAGCAGLAFSCDLSPRAPNPYLSDEGQFTVSWGINTIVFVLDTTDQVYFHRMMAKYPEMKEVLSGWEYFDNTTSVHSRTYPSVTYLLTGEKCYFDREARQHVDEAFEKSVFLKRLHEDGTDVRVFPMNPAMVGNYTQDYIANSSGYDYRAFSNLDIGKLEENLACISLYKGFPYILKPTVAYSLQNVNLSSYKPGEEKAPAYTSICDPDFNVLLYRNGITESEDYDKAFRFYHLWGCHPGYRWNEKLEGSADAAPEDALRGSFLMIQEYTQRLKNLYLYDGTTIIVTTDHGFSGGDPESLDVPAAACPLILVKYPDSDDDQPMTVNHAPVSHEDLFATIEESLDMKASGIGSGKALSDFHDGEERTRYYYYSALYSDVDGEVALREYEINGDANELENWKTTGNWWDINYSMNKVSEKRFGE